MHWTWLSNLIKPFTNIFNPVTERIGKWLGRRKPKLYVHFHATQLLWSVGHELQPDGSKLEIMNIHLTADFTHDDDKQTLLIVDVHPEGAQSRVRLSELCIRSGELLSHLQLVSFAVPVIGDKGKPWTGKLVLVDQFERQYKTKRATYRWTGPTPYGPPH